MSDQTPSSSGKELLHEELDRHLILRNLEERDFADVKAIMDTVYSGLGGSWSKKEFIAQVNTFPEGQICIEDNGKVVAAAFAVIIDYQKFGDDHTYDDIVGKAFVSTHDPQGDVLYGVDVFVDPDYRNLRLGRRLYDARKELCRQLNLRAIIAGGRIPGYRKYAGELSPHDYIEKVKNKELYDPILSFQLSNDFRVKRLLTGYLPEDRASRGYATLLEWNNLYYEKRKPKLIDQRKTTVRLGVMQWQMRRVTSYDDLLQQTEFFVDAISDYQTDLALLPEFFTAPLMGLGQQSNAVEAVRELAGYTERMKNDISQLAVSYNINIVAGSMPVLENDQLFNVSYLCRRDGTMEQQYKIHPTPHENKAWAMQGGDSIHTFDTDVGTVGILICYDVEFPELSRLMCDRGMQILFVPFWTDTKNGYLRVRRCAQARAIENECYVAISGSVGNLPRVESADLQYAQSAVFSPSDFAFPHDAIIAESSPNTEMMLLVDLDMDKLKTLRYEGSVRNFQDRRRDLYRIMWLGHK